MADTDEQVENPFDSMALVGGPPFESLKSSRKLQT
jgi:hypothetical protein